MEGTVLDSREHPYQHLSRKTNMTWGIRLPSGYWIERDADLLVLHRPDDSIVAAFSVRGADPNQIERAAREDAESH